MTRIFTPTQLSLYSNSEIAAWWEELEQRDLFEEKLPKVEKFFEECIMLPMNVFISDEDVHYVAKKVIEFYR